MGSPHSGRGFAAALVVLAIGWWANPRFERLGEDDDTDD